MLRLIYVYFLHCIFALILRPGLVVGDFIKGREGTKHISQELLKAVAFGIGRISLELVGLNNLGLILDYFFLGYLAASINSEFYSFVLSNEEDIIDPNRMFGNNPIAAKLMITNIKLIILGYGLLLAHIVIYFL